MDQSRAITLDEIDAKAAKQLFASNPSEREMIEIEKARMKEEGLTALEPSGVARWNRATRLTQAISLAQRREIEAKHKAACGPLPSVFRVFGGGGCFGECVGCLRVV